MIEERFDPFCPLNIAFWRKWFANANFDPVTLTALTGLTAAELGGSALAASAGLTAVGGGIAAASTIAGGSNAKAAAGYQATQLKAQEGTEIGAAQRTALDTQAKARMLESSATARAAASGVNAGFGSPVTDVGDIAARGEYQSLMDLWRGKEAATGDENKAQAAIYQGQIENDAARMNAAATIAGTGASMMKTYGVFTYPTPSGRAGASL